MKATTIATIVLVLTIGTAIGPNNLHIARASAYMDSVLALGIATHPPSASVQAVVVFSHIPTSADANTLQQYSTMTAPMTRLPMILVNTNYGNLNNIANYNGVVSVWANRQLTYYGNVKTVNHNSGEIPVQHSWWNEIMSVPSVWNQGYQGQGVTVALIDSGIDASNPSLGYSFPNGLTQSPYRVIQNVKVADVGEIVASAPLGPDQIYAENVINTDTTSGHGTSTSGLVAGTGAGSNGLYSGVAPKANIVGLGTGDVEFIFYPVAAYNYILAHQQQYNIKVVSNSWGTDFNCSDNLGNPTSNCDPGTPIQVATKAAHDAGIAVFFAAGNDGPGNPTVNPYSEPSWVVSVAAGTQSKGLTEFSSRGVINDPTKQPTIVAPGLNVITTKASTGAVDGVLVQQADLGNIVTPYQPFYTTFDGTSAATPQAAGVGALLLSAIPTLTPDQLKAAMKAGADPMLGYLPFQVGNGYTDAANALKSARGQGFKTVTTKTQDFGDQRFTYVQYVGGAVAVTGTWLSASVPVYQGAQSITLNASWPLPASYEWEVDVYASNDYAVADCGRERADSDCIGPAIGATSVAYSMNDPTFIASLNNPGFTAGTWTIRVFDFNEGSPITLVVDVVYASKAQTSMNNAHSIHVNDSGSAQGTEEAILQSTSGTVLSTITLANQGATSLSADITQATNSVISVVQIVVVDSTGNIIEIRGGYVATQADLNTRASQIQQQLLTTADPATISALQTELAAIQAALPNAPLTDTGLPALP